MYIVLLSGGSGKRLWPLSNDLRSKQYIRLLSHELPDGSRCSMVQRVWRQLEDAGLSDRTIVCASSGQVEMLHSQLGEIPIAVEPDRKDTFPAVALSCCYLKDRMGAEDDDVVCFIPVDPYVQSSYFNTLERLTLVLSESEADIVLMGAKPTYPSAKYGYILPKTAHAGYLDVEGFVEKPDETDAGRLIEKGALWNCGVFCFRIGFLLDRLLRYEVSTAYDELYKGYDLLPKRSFDYEVLETCDHLVVVEYDGMWKDLGTWNTLTEQMEGTSFGNVLMGSDCQGTHVVNELDIPVVVSGIESAVVVASFDGILVSSKDASSHIKDVLKDVVGRPMYEERRWGTIKTLDICEREGATSLTKKVRIFKGMTSSYHYHEKYDEVWTVLRGHGEMVIDGNLVEIGEGTSLRIRRGQRHAVKAIEELEYIEIHLGEVPGEVDMHRITFKWDEIVDFEL